MEAHSTLSNQFLIKIHLPLLKCLLKEYLALKEYTPSVIPTCRRPQQSAPLKHQWQPFQNSPNKIPNNTTSKATSTVTPSAARKNRIKTKASTSIFGIQSRKVEIDKRQWTSTSGQMTLLYLVLSCITGKLSRLYVGLQHHSFNLKMQAVLLNWVKLVRLKYFMRIIGNVYGLPVRKIRVIRLLRSNLKFIWKTIWKISSIFYSPKSSYKSFWYSLTK